MKIVWKTVSGPQLPFLSYGVGAMVTYAVFIGLLPGIYRNEKIVTDQEVLYRKFHRVSEFAQQSKRIS